MCAPIQRIAIATGDDDAPGQCLEEPVIRRSAASMHGVDHLHCTIPGSTSRANPLRYPAWRGDGMPVKKIAATNWLPFAANAASTQCYLHLT